MALSKILVVDDSDDTLKEFQEILANRNVKFIHAKTSSRAINIAMEDEIALIFVSIAMPNMDGFETVHLIRQNNKFEYIPIIVVNGNTEHLIKGIGLGANDYINKPIVPEVLIAKVENFINIYNYRLSLEKEIEKRKQLEIKNIQKQKELHHSSKLAFVGSLMARMIHEINNPLAIIDGHATLLKNSLEKERPITSEVKNIIDNQKKSVEQITRIIENVINYSKKDSDNHKDLSIHDIILHVIELVKGSNKYEGPEIQTQFKAHHSIIHGNSGKMQQIITNLISNAIDSLENVKRPVIKIATRNIEDKVVISITDNGMGIPAENIEQIFDNFFTTKGEKKGTGLGLGIVKSLSEEMSGKIEVDSKINQGTTFKVLFPFKIFKRPGKERYFNILHIETDPILQKLVGLELEAKFDCEVTSLTSPTNAIEHLEVQNDTNLIICTHDANDTKFQSEELYGYLKKKNMEIPVILTGTITKNELQKNHTFKNFFSEHVHNGYIKRPFQLETLNNKIDKIIQVDKALNLKKYCKLNIKKFLHPFNVDFIDFDLYFKLSNDKHIKIINQNEQNKSEIIQKFHNRGCRYLFCKAQDFQTFFKEYSKVIKQKLHEDKKNNVPTQQKIAHKVSAISAIHEKMVHFGISQNEIETMDMILTSSIEHIRNDPKIFPLFEKMVKTQDYLYNHSLMLLYLSGAISINTPWSNQETLEKLGIASILHDIYLETSELARISDLVENPLNENLLHKELTLIKNHPMKAQKLVKDNPSLPHDVDTIIFSHHERPDGSGFPRGIDHSNISPLSSTFILAEDVVTKLHKEKINPLDPTPLINQLKDKYSKGNFVTPLNGLIKIIN